MKKSLIVWSGGVDSTTLVYDAMLHRKNFDTLYVVLPNNRIQQNYEKKARNKIIIRLKDKFIRHMWDDDIQSEYVGQVSNGTDVLLQQPFIWLTSVIWRVDPKKYNTILFGYIRFDDFWHIKDRFVSAFNAMWELAHPGHNVPKLEFPLEWYKKIDIKNIFFADDDTFLKMSHVCENHLKSPPCGECKKCIEYNELWT